MRTIYQLMIALAVTAAPLAVVQAGGHGGGKGCVTCPECEFSIEHDDETKTCYSSDCKTICIPHFTFPWHLGSGCKGGKGDCHQKGGKDGCCLTNPGVKAKVVTVLKKYEYKCPVCKCKFTPVGKGGKGHKGGKVDGKAYDVPAPAVEGSDAGAGEVPLPEPPAVDARILYGKPVVEQAGYVR